MAPIPSLVGCFTLILSPLLKYMRLPLEEGLGAVLREMFVIGAETESVLLRWAFRLLSVHREVQRKIQDEMDNVVGAGDVLWEHRNQ